MVWVMVTVMMMVMVVAWTNVLCVLGMLAFGVDAVLPHSLYIVVFAHTGANSFVI